MKTFLLVFFLLIGVSAMSQETRTEETVTVDLNPDILFQDVSSTDPVVIRTQKLNILDEYKNDEAEKLTPPALEQARLQAIERLRKKVLSE